MNAMDRLPPSSHGNKRSNLSILSNMSHIDIYIYTRTHVYIQTHTHMYVGVCVYIYTHTHMYMHVFAHFTIITIIMLRWVTNRRCTLPRQNTGLQNPEP